VLQRITRLYLLQSASFAEVFGRFGLSFGDYEVLAALVRSGPPHRLKPSALVDALVLSSGAITNRIDRVERAGLVERLPDPDDRRSTLVALTDSGRQVVDGAVQAHLANEQRLLGALSARERRQLTELLRKLLVSEPFAALGPERAGTRNGRAAAPAEAPPAPAWRPRRR
jgi:DNA-binding MarR family transcriptional regulator